MSENSNGTTFSSCNLPGYEPTENCITNRLKKGGSLAFYWCQKSYKPRYNPNDPDNSSGLNFTPLMSIGYQKLSGVENVGCSSSEDGMCRINISSATTATITNSSGQTLTYSGGEFSVVIDNSNIDRAEKIFAEKGFYPALSDGSEVYVKGE